MTNEIEIQNLELHYYQLYGIASIHFFGGQGYTIFYTTPSNRVEGLRDYIIDLRIIM